LGTAPRRIINEGRHGRAALTGGAEIAALALNEGEYAAAWVLRTARLVPTADIMIATGVVLVIGFAFVTRAFRTLAGMSDDSRCAKQREGKHCPNNRQVG
jgi:hypothetical protein